jgi:hypothetical protein
MGSKTIKKILIAVMIGSLTATVAVGCGGKSRPKNRINKNLGGGGKSSKTGQLGPDGKPIAGSENVDPHTKTDELPDEAVVKSNSEKLKEIEAFKSGFNNDHAIKVETLKDFAPGTYTLIAVNTHLIYQTGKMTENHVEIVSENSAQDSETGLVLTPVRPPIGVGSMDKDSGSQIEIPTLVKISAEGADLNGKKQTLFTKVTGTDVTNTFEKGSGEVITALAEVLTKGTFSKDSSYVLGNTSVTIRQASDAQFNVIISTQLEQSSDSSTDTSVTKSRIIYLSYSIDSAATDETTQQPPADQAAQEKAVEDQL